MSSFGRLHLIRHFMVFTRQISMEVRWIFSKIWVKLCLCVVHISNLVELSTFAYSDKWQRYAVMLAKTERDSHFSYSSPPWDWTFSALTAFSHWKKPHWRIEATIHRWTKKYGWSPVTAWNASGKKMETVQHRIAPPKWLAYLGEKAKEQKTSASHTANQKPNFVCSGVGSKLLLAKRQTERRKNTEVILKATGASTTIFKMILKFCAVRQGI